MKIKSLLTICLILVGGIAIQAQDKGLDMQERELEIFEGNDGKYGVKDKKSIIIPAVYDKVYKPRNGYIVVILDKKFGAYNLKGKQVLPLEYDYLHPFVKPNEFFTTKNGKSEYITIDTEENNVANNNTNSIQTQQPTPTQELKPFLDFFKWGYKDKATGKVVIDAKYTFAREFSEGLAVVSLSGKSSFIDKTGKEIIPFKYGYINDFKDGVAVVKLGEYYGCINKSGKEIIPPVKYHFLFDFSDGVALFLLNNKYGLIDNSGKEIVKPTYDLVLVSDFSADLVPVNIGGVWVEDEYDGYPDGGKWGFINKTGKVVIPLEYDFVFAEFEHEGSKLVEKYFKNEKVKVLKNGREFYIDKTGKEVK